MKTMVNEFNQMDFNDEDLIEKVMKKYKDFQIEIILNLIIYKIKKWRFATNTPHLRHQVYKRRIFN
jgi:hypothetical protein